MNIIYEDIKLRAIEEKDLGLLHEMINDPEIGNMTGGAGFPVSMYQQRKWFESLQNNNNELRLIIDTKEHGAIGQIILSDINYKNRTAEIHSKIATSKNIRGKGYGTRAYKALLNYSFDFLNLNCIYGVNLDNNVAPEKVKIKLGFQKEGVLRERVYKNGKYFNQHIWSLTKHDYQKMRNEK